VLVSYEPATNSIEDKFLAVVTGVKAFENFLVDSHGWKMLDIWVVINRVADYVVNVMRSFPPPNADPSYQIANHYAKNVVHTLDVCDSVVS